MILADTATSPASPPPPQATWTLRLNLEAKQDVISRLAHTSPAGTGARPRERGPTLIYTSGSTGQPKGVVIEHRKGQSTSCTGLVSNWAVTPRDAVLALAHSLTFERLGHGPSSPPLLAGAGWC